MKRLSQADQILILLKMYRRSVRQAVSAYRLAQISLRYGARIMELRRQGHNIEQIELPRVNGVRRTAYKLVKIPLANGKQGD